MDKDMRAEVDRLRAIADRVYPGWRTGPALVKHVFLLRLLEAFYAPARGYGRKETPVDLSRAGDLLDKAQEG